MPRQSAASLSVVRPATNPSSSRLSPPECLSTDERLLFTMLAKDNRHLRPSDSPMLACYCMTVTKVCKLARRADVAPWERAVKVLMALARTMRISQQAMRDPKTVARAVRHANDEASAQLWASNGEIEDDDGNAHSES